MKIMALALVLTVFIVACTPQENAMGQDGGVMESKETEGTMMDKDTTSEGQSMEKDSVPKIDGSMMEKDTMQYSGMTLAGKDSPYLEFKQADYERALQEGKTVLLYFYANWCPICKAEQPQTLAAFSELTRSDVVGFRVNYKDSETDGDEEELAKEFGITYQHTKVIIVDGKQSVKSLENWDKARYLSELSKGMMG